MGDNDDTSGRRTSDGEEEGAGRGFEGSSTADAAAPVHDAGHEPIYPRLSRDADPSEDEPGGNKSKQSEVGEPAAPASFDRSASPTTAHARNRGAAYERVGEGGVCRMHKFSLYETATRYYIVGADMLDRHFRVLKIDRTAEAGDLSIAEDEIVYTKKEMNQLLNAIDDGNKSTGGMSLKCSTWGILGFIRFTGAYYMLLITKRSQVAMIGGHYIYQVDDTELVALTTSATSRFKLDRNAEESRFLAILNNLDLTRSFYFSYSYDITRTLQQNIAREREGLTDDGPRTGNDAFNAMFAWNHYLLEPAHETLKNTHDWCLPIVHGYVDQASKQPRRCSAACRAHADLSSLRLRTNCVSHHHRETLSLLCRGKILEAWCERPGTRPCSQRRHFADTSQGYVANDVETEQIVSEMLTTSFHAPGPKLYANPNYTSYVQHRGSIPLYWTQDNTGVTPKPPIERAYVCSTSRAMLSKISEPGRPLLRRSRASL